MQMTIDEADVGAAEGERLVGGLRLGGTTVDPSVIPEPLGYRVLIEPVQVDDCTAGGIILPEMAKKREAYMRKLGRVVAMGPSAFTGSKSVLDWGDVAIGDWVLHNPYNGMLFRVEDGNGQIGEYRVVNDDEILMRVPDPVAFLNAA